MVNNRFMASMLNQRIQDSQRFGEYWMKLGPFLGNLTPMPKLKLTLHLPIPQLLHWRRLRMGRWRMSILRNMLAGRMLINLILKPVLVMLELTPSMRMPSRMTCAPHLNLWPPKMPLCLPPRQLLPVPAARLVMTWSEPLSWPSWKLSRQGLVNQMFDWC